MNDKEFFYDIAKFEVQAIYQRNNFLLVFQSMLFAATALIAQQSVFFSIWVPMGLGLVLSIIWLYLNWLTQVIEVGAMNKLLDIDPRMVELLKARESNFLLSKGSVSFIVAFVFPVVMLLCWLIIIFFYVA
ncbi:hypothetical protein IHQ56_03305 [Methylobacillus flagellatus]|uniref:RipA family octameric membrane protein n=1 Tax=Methylobacillus flagellatus TaxID=405 RepID=UPI00285394FA|nr:hypothetical protein [Methylobacillus flagellatus]MDR5170838.1 hypothetical protein [Methylobacillus flagellatus]